MNGIEQLKTDFLSCIDSMATKMMEGEELIIGNHHCSINTTLYYKDDSYPIIEKSLAESKTVNEKLLAIKELQSLMYLHCRKEAAAYLRVDLNKIDETEIGD